MPVRSAAADRDSNDRRSVGFMLHLLLPDATWAGPPGHAQQNILRRGQSSVLDALADATGRTHSSLKKAQSYSTIWHVSGTRRKAKTPRPRVSAGQRVFSTGGR